MATTQRTITYDDIFTSSQDKVWPGVVDQLQDANPTYEFLNKNGRTKESGGPTVIIPIRRSRNTTVNSYALYGTINTDRQNDNLTIAYQDRRYIAGTIRYSPEEEGLNSGDEAVVDLIAERLDGLEKDMKDFTASQLWRFSAGNGGLSPDPIPLAAISDPTAATTFMGIDPSAETYWRNQRADSSATTFNGLKRDIADIISLIARRDGANADFGICDWTTWNTLVAAFSSLVRIEDKNTVNYGYKHKSIVIEGVRIFPETKMVDAQNQLLSTASPLAGTLYVMDSEAVRLEYLNGMKMKRLPWVQDANGTDRAQKVLLSVNLIVKARRLLGQLENISRTITA